MPIDVQRDFFVSYASADNREGWVDGFVRELVGEHNRFTGGRELTCFLDTDNIPLPWLKELVVADFPALATAGKWGDPWGNWSCVSSVSASSRRFKKKRRRRDKSAPTA